MVVHNFICDDCRVTVQDTSSKGVHECPKCGKDMRWDLEGLGCRCNYKQPIHSDALAVSPAQRVEHEQMFPYIKLDEENRPIFDNFNDHERYLKAAGFIKNTKKKKIKGKRIA